MQSMSPYHRASCRKSAIKVSSFLIWTQDLLCSQRTVETDLLSYVLGVYPLDDLNSAKLARADSGTLILISQDTAKAAIEQLLCDVLSVHKLHSHDTSGPHRPLLTQHITVGFVATPNVQSRINGLGDSLRRLAAEPRCGASNVTSDAGVRPLPSISLTHFDYYRFPSAMDELRPRAVLSTLDANLDKDYQHLVRYRQDVWISLGQDDLQHSGWILTLPNRAIKGADLFYRAGIKEVLH